MFILEDDFHAEQIDRFDTYEAALNRIKELSNIPWDIEPNKCPCESWEKCGREYVIVEYEQKGDALFEKNRNKILNISSAGTDWKI